MLDYIRIQNESWHNFKFSLSLVVLVNETRGVWLLNNFTEARNAGTTLGSFEVNFNERLRKYYGDVGPFEVEFDETLHKYYGCGPLFLS